MRSDLRPGSLGRLSDDQLGSIAVSLVVSELRWTPDVAPAVLDRISREAVAYPDHFDRRPRPMMGRLMSRRDEPSVARTLLRIGIFAVVIVLVAILVLVASTAEAGMALAPGLAAVAALVSSPSPRELS